MSAVRPPERVPHGRVVVVGDGDSLRRVSQRMPRPVIHARNLFDALGEVTVATAAEPVAAVLVPTHMLSRSSPSPADAFRRIDPAVRLVLMTESKDQLQGLASAADGFDAVLEESAGPTEFEDAVAGTRPPLDSTPAAVPRPPSAEQSVSSDAVPKAGLSVQPPAAGPPADLRPPPAPVPELLGDTDLVESILTDPAGLRDRALQLMSQQTHWSDLALTEDRPQRDSVACADVCFQRRSYGTLSSGQATEKQLRPWAQWLARWLALDTGYRDFRTKAFHDELTGACNRRFYDVFMRQTLHKASRDRRAVTVMVFDLDDFKNYNDQFGHGAGDEVLCETVRLLNSVIRRGDRVCRIGGDEFVVIFADPEGPREPGSNPPETVGHIAKRFQDQICLMKFPKLGLDAPGTLSISGGLATYPWDATDPQSLLAHADQLALQSKKKGKNVLTFGPGARGICR